MSPRKIPPPSAEGHKDKNLFKYTADKVSDDLVSGILDGDTGYTAKRDRHLKSAKEQLERARPLRNFGQPFEKFGDFVNLEYNRTLEDLQNLHLEPSDHAPTAEALQRRLVENFRRAFNALDLSPTAAQAFAQNVLHQTFAPSNQELHPTSEGTAKPLPTKAPALYKDRSDRKEKPDAFIKREYARWLGPDDKWPRKILNDLDPSLYLAVSRYGLSKELDEKLYKIVGNPKKLNPSTDSENLSKIRETKRKSMKRYRDKKQDAKL